MMRTSQILTTSKTKALTFPIFDITPQHVNKVTLPFFLHEASQKQMHIVQAL